MLNNLTIKSLIFCILLSQLVTVTHAFEHDSLDHENEQCFICLQNADQQEVLFSPSAFKEINKTHFERIYYQSQSICSSSFYLFKNRGPPCTSLVTKKYFDWHVI